MTQVELTLEAKEAQTMALSVPDQARALVIRDPETAQKASDLKDSIRQIRKKIADTFNPIIEKAHQAHKEALAKKKEAEAPLLEAEAILDRGLVEYKREQDRKAEEERKRILEEARRQAEEAQLAAAVEVEKAGMKEEAELIITQPVIPMVSVPKTEAPKIQGVGFRSNWKFRIVNESLIPNEYKTIDMVKIGGVVRALKGATNIPGVEVYEELATVAGVRK